ncbi:MAG: GWxTD domain-containing protein [Cyclobacteriaceae bacterium]
MHSKQLAFILTTLLVFFVNQYTSAQVFKDIDLKSKYDVNGDLTVSHRLYHDGGSFTIYFSVALLHDMAFAENYIISTEIKPSYTSLESLHKDTLNLEQAFLGKNVNEYYFSYTQQSIPDAELLVLKIFNKNSREVYYHDIQLSTRFNFPAANILPQYSDNGLPMLRSFHYENEPLTFNPVFNSSGQIFVYYYSNDFEIADPPMIVESQQVSRGLTLDSLFVIEFGEEISFTNKGLYLLQLDTASSEAVSIRIEDKDYPRFTLIDDLLKPTVYISTRNERAVLESTASKRAAFESFWVNTTKSEDLAKTVIRMYYRKAQESNFLFSNYKEGWKTDMGMVYMVFGKPDRVHRDEQIEEWIYRGDVPTSSVNFTFVKVKNIFSNNHYALIRDKKYDRAWFRTVESWRRGRLRN